MLYKVFFVFNGSSNVSILERFFFFKIDEVNNNFIYFYQCQDVNFGVFYMYKYVKVFYFYCY